MSLEQNPRSKVMKVFYAMGFDAQACFALFQG
jgi:hypothetical protein